MRQTKPEVQGEVSAGASHWLVVTSSSSVLSALVASACCVGPLVLALLGIGSAGLLIKLEPYRPYFIAVTFVLLGTGFYLTYREPKATASSDADGPECPCPAPPAGHASKVLLWIATVLVGVLLAFPYLAPHLVR